MTGVYVPNMRWKIEDCYIPPLDYKVDAIQHWLELKVGICNPIVLQTSMHTDEANEKG